MSDSCDVCALCGQISELRAAVLQLRKDVAELQSGLEVQATCLRGFRARLSSLGLHTRFLDYDFNELNAQRRKGE